MFRLPPLESGEEKKDKGVLVLVNPSNPTQAVIDSIKKIENETNSEVRYLVSPCDWHYLFIGHYLPHFPNAKAYVPPGRIPAQKPKYEFTLIDMQNPLPELSPGLKVLSWQGMSDNPSAKPVVPRGDFVFFHAASKTVTAGDCLYYLNSRSFTSVLAGQVTDRVSFNYKGWKAVYDAEKCVQTVKTIMGWDFDRFIPLHGNPGNLCPQGAKEHIGKLLPWFRDPPKRFKGVAPQPESAVAKPESAVAKPESDVAKPESAVAQPEESDD